MTSDAEARTIGGRYRLDRSIGQGGMGTVWEGRDELLGRPVAVKEVRFPPELGDREIADLRERTLREARATARLSHPNVITTYDVVEEEDGRPWIVMELLPTRSLSEVLREGGPLPAPRVAKIGLDVLAALEISHAEGIVHRDVKPSNVLLTEDGRAVLTDFGIATVAGDPALTSTGVVLGSPAFMSPERARGHGFGPESDLWSLGATLYSAAEGRPPYDAENPLGTLTAIISDPVPAMSVDGPLADAVTGLLGKDPASRMDIGAARDLLTAAAAERGSGAVAATTPAETVALDRAGRTEVLAARRQDQAAPASSYDDEPAYERRRRGPGLLMAALAVALLILVGLLGYALTRPVDDNNPTAGPGKKNQKSSASESPPTQSSSPPPSTNTPPPNNGLPAGFRLYRDPSGFAVGVPDGWQAEQVSSTIVDVREPGGPRFLRFDQTDQPKPDPAKDWENQEKSFQADHPDYQRIRIESVDYRDYDAADWEFTFEGTHVLDRGFVTGPRQAYAIYLSAPDEQWAESQQIFQTAADTFKPAT